MKCKYCGKEIEEGSVFCGYCGKKQPQVKYCIKCGHEIEPDHRWCGFCGAEQISVDNIKEDDEGGIIKVSPKSSSHKYLIIGAVVALIAIVASVGYYAFSGEKRTALLADTTAVDSGSSGPAVDYDAIDSSSMYPAEDDAIDSSYIVHTYDGPDIILPFSVDTKLSEIAAMNGGRFGVFKGRMDWNLIICYRGNTYSGRTDIQDNETGLLTQSGYDKIFDVVAYDSANTINYVNLKPSDFSDFATVRDIDIFSDRKLDE